MAAPTPRPLIHRALRIARKAFAWFALALGLFMLAGWIGSSIPRNNDWQEPGADEPGAVTIMVETNGVHTALILPASNTIKDWRADFPTSDIAAANRPYSHISISWGEKDVFLNTETWGDLSPLTVLRIVGIGGEGLLHISHYVRPAPSDNNRKLTLTADQYRKLVRAIEPSILPPDQRQSYPGYGTYDVFYDAPGSYTILNTCNQWTSDRLADAGVETGWWTPFAGGVMKWVPPLGEPND